LGAFLFLEVKLPYIISKKDKEYCVYKEGDDGKPMGKSHGCHPTHDKAMAQMRALYAAGGKSFEFFGEEIKATKRPDREFLVIEEDGKQHLPVYKDGKLSPRLLGAAHAALTVGYRGNKYAGPGKEEALSKLKRLYKKAGLKWQESKEGAKKTISLFDLEQKVRQAVKDKMMEATGADDEYDMPYCPIDVFVDFAIIKAPAGLYQVPYSIDAETYEITLGELNKVKIEYIPDDTPPEDMGNDADMEVYHEMMNKDIDLSVKALGEDRIGGYAVLWGSESKKDLTGEFFDKDTEELTTIFDAVGKLPYLYHHGLDETIKTTVVGIVDTLVRDDVGLWYEVQLKKAKDYAEHVKKLVEGGVKKLIAEKRLKTSTQTFPVSRRVEDNGRIARWPVVEITGTVTPAEHRLQSVSVLKTAYQEVGCTDFECVLKKFGVQDTDVGQGAEKARLLAEVEQTRLEMELV